MASDALASFHLQCSLNGVRHLVDVVGIDDERVLDLLGGAGEARQNEHARIGWVLRRNVFLGDKVHAVAQGRHEADAGGAIDVDQQLARRRAVDVVDRHPVELAEAAVDRA